MSTFPPKLVLHKASGQARVRWQGRDFYLGKYGSPEAQAAYARLLAQLAEGQPPSKPHDAGPLTVAQVIAEWQARELPRYDVAGGEPEGFARSLVPLLKLFGSLAAKEFDVVRLEAVRYEMVKADLCCNTINRRITRIKTLWRWCEAQGHVPRGSWAHLRTLPVLARNNRSVRHTQPVEPARWEDVKQVLRHCNAVVRSMLLTQWWTGSRSGEVCRMRKWEIEVGQGVWLYRPARHKMSHRGQDRVIVLGKKAQAVVRPWLARVEDYLFLSRKGLPHTSNSYAQAVAFAARRAKLRLFPYQLRHAAKERITRAFGLDAARAILGQKSLGTTNSYANQLDLDTARRVAGEMG